MITKHFRMNQRSALNNSEMVDTPLNNPSQTKLYHF